MDIKELLGDIENAEVIAETINKEIAKAYMPRTKFNEVNEELKATKEQMENNKKQLDEFSNNASITEDLQKQVEEMKTQHETFKGESETRESNMKKTQAIKDGLINRKANNEAIDLLVPTIGLDGVQLDGKGNIVDADDLFKPIMETRSSLFSKTITEGTEPRQGNVNNIDMNTLSDTEYFKQKMEKINQ